MQFFLIVFSITSPILLGSDDKPSTVSFPTVISCIVAITRELKSLFSHISLLFSSDNLLSETFEHNDILIDGFDSEAQLLHKLSQKGKTRNSDKSPSKKGNGEGNNGASAVTSSKSESNSAVFSFENRKSFIEVTMVKVFHSLKTVDGEKGN